MNHSKKGRKQHPAATKQVVRPRKKPHVVFKKRRSDRARMRINIQKAQRDTTPVLKKKAYTTILRKARGYMTRYRDNPMISQSAAEVLIQDLDMDIHNIVMEACARANLSAGYGKNQTVPTLNVKHIRSVMNDDRFRRSHQACFVPSMDKKKS